MLIHFLAPGTYISLLGQEPYDALWFLHVRNLKTSGIGYVPSAFVPHGFAVNSEKIKTKIFYQTRVG